MRGWHPGRSRSRLPWRPHASTPWMMKPTSWTKPKRAQRRLLECWRPSPRGSSPKSSSRRQPAWRPPLLSPSEPKSRTSQHWTSTKRRPSRTSPSSRSPRGRPRGENRPNALSWPNALHRIRLPFPRGCQPGQRRSETSGFGPRSWLRRESMNAPSPERRHEAHWSRFSRSSSPCARQLHSAQRLPQRRPGGPHRMRRRTGARAWPPSSGLCRWPHRRRGRGPQWLCASSSPHDRP